jgi:rhomboid protease GluP
LILAIILVVVFIVEVVLGAAGEERALLPFGALRTRGWSAVDSWRILTFSFLHLTWFHLAIDAIGVVWLGGIVERRLGSARFAAIVAAAGLASGAAAMLLGPFLPTTGIAIGASGVIFGLFAAALVLVFGRPPAQTAARDRRLRKPLVICFIAAAGVSFVPGVSGAGHLGGFIGGVVLAWMFVSRSS